MTSPTITIPSPLKNFVRLKAPHWSGYSSVVGRDWKQLIGRKPAYTTAVKTGLGETPPERGIPRRIELRQINTIHSVGRSKKPMIQ
jgi:hypothetical protein